MLDIIRDGAAFDFAYVYSSSIDNLIFMLRNLVVRKSKDFVSLYESNEPKCQKALDKLIDAFNELD
ncbi:MAG: hypothetical protein FWH48_06100, partial [Oscillospiraceae bacterium]|nr:hypothetical protein [Oscillospiraceae bacterium]